MTSQAFIDQYMKENKVLKEQIERRSGKTTAQLYEEREKRVREVIELKVPDRAPFSANINMHLYTGVPNSAAYYDPLAFKKAVRKITLDFEPDMCNAGLPSSGAAKEALDVQNGLWPGWQIPADYEYQFVEGEYMKEDEYDMFLNDPSGFMIRRYLPRVYGALAPLAKLPRLDSMFQGFEAVSTLFATPEFLEMTSRLAESGRRTLEFRKNIGDTQEELAQLGFPAFAPVSTGGVGGAPFDSLSSFLRGMKGSMVDMYRRPDKLIRACDMILERRKANSFPADPAKRGNPKKIGVPLWRGDKVFMSEAQFKKFYWPGLKKALQANIDLGYVPVPFFEAEFGDRLECLLELPKGKIVASVEHMDAVKAREILGGHTCILTRGPLSSKLWSLREVESYTRDLIDKVGKKGGLILDLRLPDKAKTEDIQAMIKSLTEYARY
jgi:hypothetical protein